MLKNNWFFLVVLVLFIGCYDEKEGCLDPEALNFDVSADKDCCCDYPALVIKANFKKDDTTGFNFFSGYLKDDAGHVYLVKSVKLYLSGIEIMDDSDVWYNPKDSTERWVYGVMPEKEQISNNALVVKSSNTKGYSFAEYAQSGIKSRVRMNLGLTPEQIRVIPDSLSEKGPLAFLPDSLWIAPKQYAQQEWIVVTDTSESNYTIDTFQVLEGGGVIDQAYTAGYDLPKGTNFDLSVDIIVPKWLSGIDWAQDKASILEKLQANAASAISLVQL